MTLKRILLFCLTLSISVAFTQTPEIAHKSHSGSNAHFNPAINSNPGLPDFPPVLFKVQRVNDTTVRLFYTQVYGNPYEVDIYNDKVWLNAHLHKDSIQTANISSELIEFVGYENLDKKVFQQEKAKSEQLNRREYRQELFPFIKSPSLPTGLLILVLIGLFVYISIKSRRVQLA